MVDNVNDLVCCEECGDLNIEEQAWVKVNTGKYSGDLGVNENYCPKCSMNTKAILVSEYIKQKIEDET